LNLKSCLPAHMASVVNNKTGNIEKKDSAVSTWSLSSALWWLT
jgi:hypothetical protein